jgi:phospholipid/cholesterol/gamma-HCH transport system ATP-binding protein
MGATDREGQANARGEAAGTLALAQPGLEGRGPASPVELRDVVYVVEGTPVLRGVSLAVRRGEIFGVMGLSGSGKSTLLKLIMGLLTPTRGDVLIEGRSIVGLGERELNEVRRSMGMCFQNAALFDSMTVAGNIRFALRSRRRVSRAEANEVVADCLDRVGLHGVEDHYPAELSGGMKKRVGIARALALEPRVMLYDEPSSGLDPVTASVIDDLIVHLSDDLGVTSIVVSHHVRNLFAVADRVMMIYHERVEQVGTPEELRENGTDVVRQFVQGRPTGPIVT